jgi:hypothetical protein
MSNHLDTMSASGRWQLMVEAAKRGAAEQGYKMRRMPGRGLSNIWNLDKDGTSQLTSIRTTRDRWIAFPPLLNGTKWKTLDDVELVLVATVDSKENPQKVEVYILPANEVRQRFDAAYKARKKAGHVHTDNFGMWVGLDPDPRGIATSVGAGIIENYKPIAVYSIDTLVAQTAEVRGDDDPSEERAEQPEARPATIAEVMAWARERVAEIAGVRVESVKLDLKVEY